MYLFVFLLILNILYFIFRRKHDLYGKNWTIFNLCQKKNYIILNFNYPMVNTLLVIFLNQKVGSILNPIRKVSLSILPTTF